MKISHTIILGAIAAVLTIRADHAFGQTNGYLPVYTITQAGATESQTFTLASALGIPTSQLVFSNGLVTFIDPTNYLYVPSASNAFNFAALSNWNVLARAAAVNWTGNALAAAGLTPQSGAPIAGSSTIYFYSATGGAEGSTNGYPIDTEVNYTLTSPNGYPLIGPGAQAQVDFGTGSNVTRLLYSVQGLSAGNFTVQLISSAEFSSRAAALLPAGAQVESQLVYYAPGFRPPPGPPCYECPPPRWSPVNVLPYYLFAGRINVTNPVNGAVSTIRTRAQMIPATDDSRFVPSVSINAYGSNQVSASVSVSGGLPPYTYVWAGSDPNASTNSNTAISYTPRTRIAAPALTLTRQAMGSLLRISWPAPAPGFILQSTTNLANSNSWSQVTAPVSSEGVVNFVTLNDTNRTAFYRLALAGPTVPQTERVSVTVYDANGVAATASQILNVQATPSYPIFHGGGTLTYGAESPADPGEWTPCRVGWQNGMTGPNAGTQSFCWMGDLAWPGDFIEPNPAGTLVAQPWIFGDADYANWGINCANLVLDIADGWSDGKTAMQPDVPVADYPTSELSAPDNANDVVLSLGLGGPDNYNVNYDQSWGPIGPNDTLAWLCTDDCDMLDASGNFGLNVAQRWGPVFNGLHVFAGFASLDYGDGPFEQAFAADVVTANHPLTVVQSWVNAASATSAGTAAAMGPMFVFGNLGQSNFYDIYTISCATSGTIPPAQCNGYWYLVAPQPPQYLP